MDLLLVVLLLLAVGGVVAVALGRVGGGLAPAPDQVAPPLGERLSRPGDLDAARFAPALRGYRMDQVDAVLDEARDLLAAKDDEIARLRRSSEVQRQPVEPLTAAPVDPRPVDPRPGDPRPGDPRV